MTSNPISQALPFLERAPIPSDSAITILPLGGTNRVGMNCYAVGTKGRWVLIDLGATFPGADDDFAAEFAERHEARVESIFPDPRSFGDIINRLDAIILTHAHEDHVGGIAPLLAFSEAWPRLSRVPIWGTKYTIETVQNRLREYGRSHPMRELHPKRTTRIGQFDITPIRVTHSAPQTMAILLACKAGRIIHASDVKVDSRPVIGAPTDFGSLERVGRAGVLAFLADSTNAHRSGRSRSEGEVMDGLTDVMRSATGRVYVSTFASNVARIEGIRGAARRSGRSLASSGFSIQRNFETASATGVLQPNTPPLIDARRLHHGIPKRKMAVVCTGTQAEERSALRRLTTELELGAFSNSGPFRIEAGDTVVHSARAIPGNEATVRMMLDTLRAKGVNVLDANSGLPIHASGHGHRDELMDLYRAIRPRFAMPVHGNEELIEAHLDLARSVPSVRDAQSPREGEAFRVSEAGIERLGAMSVDLVAYLKGVGSTLGTEKLVAWPSGEAPDLKREANERRRGMTTRRAPSSERSRGEQGLRATV